MKGPLRTSAPLLLTAALFLSACGSKDAEPAPQAEAPAPPDIEAPAEDAATAGIVEPMVLPNPEAASREPQPPAPPMLEPATGTAPPAPTPAEMEVVDAPNVPAEVAASDASYEEWFKKHKLNLSDPAMLDADPDGDGVSNRDEFLADTDPNVGEGRPGFHKTMRLKQFSEVKLPLMLEGVEGNTARIKRLDEPQARVESVRAGDTLRGLPFRVGKVQSRRGTDKAGERVDASRVTLEDPVTKEQTVLVKDMPARSTASHAVLVSADGASTMTVRLGDVFSWPGDEAFTYKVVDLRADQAVLEQVETGKMVTVPKK